MPQPWERVSIVIPHLVKYTKERKIIFALFPSSPEKMNLEYFPAWQLLLSISSKPKGPLFEQALMDTVAYISNMQTRFPFLTGTVWQTSV